MSINWNAVASSLLNIVKAAPSEIGIATTVIGEVVTIYDEVKSEMSATDQASIDSALAAAQASDQAATDKADAALDPGNAESAQLSAGAGDAAPAHSQNAS